MPSYFNFLLAGRMSRRILNLPPCILLPGRSGGVLHFSPGTAPHSGQRTPSASFIVTTPACHKQGC
jgi:hypothetical protein